MSQLKELGKLEEATDLDMLEWMSGAALHFDDGGGNKRTRRWIWQAR